MKESKPVRIDPELYELLSLEAKAQGRSITSQVNFMLKVAIVRGLTRPPLTATQKRARIARMKISRERNSKSPIKRPNVQKVKEQYTKLMKDKE